MVNTEQDKQAALDSVTLINNLINKIIVPTNGPDPYDPVSIIQPNINHLSKVYNTLPFSETELESINAAIVNGEQFVVDNGGGGPTPSSTIGYFVDCVDGYIIGVDFSPKDAPSVIGQVYYITALGYKGCATVIKQPNKLPAIYSKGEVASNYFDCAACRAAWNI